MVLCYNKKEITMEGIDDMYKFVSRLKFLFDKKINYFLFVLVFVAYVWLLVWAIGFKFVGIGLTSNSIAPEYMLSKPISERIGLNWIPFYSIFNCEHNFHTYTRHVTNQLEDLLMNILIYMPLGAFVFILFNEKRNEINSHINKHAVLITLITSLISSVIFELVQLFTGYGGYDGTDILSNFLGGLLGMLIVIVIKKKTIDKFPKVANIIFLCLSCIFIPMAIFAGINAIIRI